MRSTSYKFTSLSSPYASSSCTSQSSSSGLPSFSSRSSTVGIHSATDYGTKRFPSSTSATISSADQNVASFDYVQLGSKSPNAADRNSIANRPLSLTTSACEHRATDITVDKSAQRLLKKEKDNGSLVTASQLLGGRNLKATTENNKGARQSSTFGVGDDQNKIQGSDRNVVSAYSRSSVDFDSSITRNIKPFSDNYRRAPLRRQSAVSSESYEAMPNTAAISHRDAPVQRVRSASHASIMEQQIFLRRLLQAHNLVDDMLRSRGMNPDDERNYLRFLQQVPEGREEEQRCSQVFRSSSASGSDSGLSLDNDSDQSIDVECTLAGIPSEENVDVEEAFVSDPQEQLTESILPCKKLFYELSSLTAKLPNKWRTKHSKVNLAKSKLNDEASSKSDERDEATITDKRLQKKTIPQRTMEALFQQSKKARCSAEISIQHVSFYQVAQSVAEQMPVVEKMVKIHFRLTQRHHAASRTTIRLPQVNRALRVALDVKSPENRAPKYRVRTIEIPQLEGLNSPASLRRTVPAHVRRKSTSSRVRIPENFQKTLNPTREATRTTQSHDTDDALRHARDNLRRVAFNHTVSTVVVDNCELMKAPKSRDNAVRVSDEKLAETASSGTETELLGIKPEELDVEQSKQTAADASLNTRRSNMQNSEEGEKKPSIPPKTTTAGKVPEKIGACGKSGMQDNAAINTKTKKALEESDDENGNMHKNEKYTAAHALTCINNKEVRKALQKTKTNEATDVTLVNEFRRNKVIPAPQVIIRAEMPQMVAAPTRVLNVKPVRDFVEPLPPPKFLRRRTPERFLLETTLPNHGVSNKCESNEVVLRPVKRILKTNSASNSTVLTVPQLQLQQMQPQSSNTIKNPFGVHLKRIDRHAIENRSRGAITQSTAKKPWIPKWRRVECSEEEDVEEEERAEVHGETRMYSGRGSSFERRQSQQQKKDEKENAVVGEAEKLTRRQRPCMGT
uniref:Uncharacterized protein n=1 Tax=Parascaris univalens TaxID=6257 RepID=A0A915A5K0_PARUN